MTYKSRAFARELIAQQTNDLADKLTALMEDVFKSRSQKEAQASEACKGIVSLLQKRVGIKIDLLFDTTEPPACMPLMANAKHVLSTMMVNGAYAEQTNTFENTIKRSSSKKGTIDLKNGKLGGIYSEIECPVWMSFYFCKENFTPRETVAVLMHEIGHLFLAFEMMYRTIRASQVLAALHQVRTKRDDSITYEHALELAGADLTGDPKEFINCITMKNDTAICSVVFSRVYHKMANDFGDDAVAGVNFEVLADNFSTKWGLATDLTTALLKLYGEHSLGRVNAFGGFLMYITPLLMSMLFTAVSAVYFGSLLGGIVGGVILVTCGIFFGGRSDNSIKQTNVYDKPYVRFQRIRETIIVQMKYLNLDPVVRDRLLKEVAIINKIIAGGREMTDIYEDISKIFTSNRRAEFAFKLERDIELLANNDLFVNVQRLASKA